MPENDRPRVISRRKNRAGHWLPWVGLLLAVVGAVLVLVPGPGYRWQLWGLGVAFTLLRWGAFVGLAGGIISLLALLTMFTRPGRRVVQAFFAGVGLLIGAASFGLPWALLQQAHSVPPIHDITTDTVQPPIFHAILPLRRDAPNSAVYGGLAIAREQRQAYPDIKPLQFQVSPKRAFAAALKVAKDMGWRIVAAVPQAQRIEATATTSWFGFKDDIVIRIRAAEPGARVDIRSVSRVGVSDLGKNAERIRQFRDRLTRVLTGEAIAPATS